LEQVGDPRQSYCRARNHSSFPIKILDAHSVEFTLVSHSRIAHQDDDIAEKLKGSPSPGAGLGSFEQLPFCFIVKPKVSAMLHTSL